MRIRTAEIILTVLAVAICAAAQQTPAPVFKSRTDLVLVPVVVHDKEGKHVPGLKAEDFRLEDNGSRQKTASLEEVAADRSVPGPPSELAPDIRRGVVFTNQLAHPSQPKQLLIFAIDLVNAPFVDTELGRRAMLGFVASHMSPNRTMALVAIEPGRVRLLHSFTTSPTILSTALQKVTAVASTPATQPEIDAAQAALKDQQTYLQTGELLAGVANPQQATVLQMANFIAGQRREMSQAFLAATAARNTQNIASALESMRIIASWVAGVAGRKELVWLTGDIPWISGQGTISLGKMGSEDYERTMKALADANVAIYPVDVRGVVPQTMYVKGYVDPGRQQEQTMAEALDASPSGIARRSASLQRGVVHMADAHEAMNYLANLTGGRAYYNRNDIPRVLDEAADDSSRYYMLAFYLDRGHAKPGWHKLKVGVERDGVSVRARNGFFVPKPGQEESASARQSDERLAIGSPFEYTALPVTLKWAGTTPQGDKRRVSFEVNIPPTASLVGADQNTLDMDFIATAMAGNGEMAGSSSRAFRAALKPDALQKVETFGVTYLSNVDVKPGQYSLRLVVRDNLTGRLGSVMAPLNVAP